MFTVFFEAWLRRDEEIRTAVFYCADALRMIGENTANFSGGRYIRSMLSDILNVSDGQAYDVSGEEVIRRMKERLRE